MQPAWFGPVLTYGRHWGAQDLSAQEMGHLLAGLLVREVVLDPMISDPTSVSPPARCAAQGCSWWPRSTPLHCPPKSQSTHAGVCAAGPPTLAVQTSQRKAETLQVLLAQQVWAAWEVQQVLASIGGQQ